MVTRRAAPNLGSSLVVLVHASDSTPTVPEVRAFGRTVLTQYSGILVSPAPRHHSFSMCRRAWIDAVLVFPHGVPYEGTPLPPGEGAASAHRVRCTQSKGAYAVTFGGWGQHLAPIRSIVRPADFGHCFPNLLPCTASRDYVSSRLYPATPNRICMSCWHHHFLCKASRE